MKTENTLDGKTLGDSSSGVVSQTMSWKAADGSKCLKAVYYSGDGHADEKSPNDYDEGNEREHRELSHIVSRTPQTTTSNSFLRFSVWSFSNQY